MAMEFEVESVPASPSMAALRSRVEQQSTLIAMLKQRGDNTLSELTESQTNYKMLSVTMEALQERLSHEETQRKQLEQRFSILADNHEEMIRIKDEYKRANSDLQAKYGAHLSKECEKCTSLENELTETRKAFSENEKMCATLTSDCSTFQSTILLLEKQLEAIKKAIEEHKEHLTGRINDYEEQVCRLELCCRNNDEQKQQLQVHIQHLEKDKESIALELMSQKTLLLRCEENLKNSLDREQTAQEAFRLRREEVSRDACVKQLRQQLLTTEEKLSTIENDYTAYKNHSAQLLAHERELNNKLRHILD